MTNFVYLKLGNFLRHTVGVSYSHPNSMNPIGVIDPAWMCSKIVGCNLQDWVYTNKVGQTNHLEHELVHLRNELLPSLHLVGYSNYVNKERQIPPGTRFPLVAQSHQRCSSELFVPPGTAQLQGLTLETPQTLFQVLK